MTAAAKRQRQVISPVKETIKDLQAGEQLFLKGF